jgi:HEAT repeat protein
MDMHPSTASRAARMALLPAFLLALVAAPYARAEDSFEDLVANLKSPTARTRQSAAEQLGKTRRREAVAPLSALVRDPEPKVRLAVVGALRQLRDTSGIPALVTSLQDGDPGIRDEAISAIVEVYGDRERGGPIDRFLETFSDEYDRSSLAPYTNVDPGVFRGLAAVLRDENKGIRADAAYAVGILGGSSVSKELIAALQDPESSVRAAAATALGKVGTSEEGKALIPLLADESTNVRNRAMEAVGVLRVRDAGPPLREMFEQNRRRELGARVLSSLSRIGDPAQADLFRELLTSNDPEQRRLAVEGLGRVADASMLDAFKTDYQREKNGAVRVAYNFSLVRLGDHAFVDGLALALGSGGGNAERARDYLMEIGPSIAPDLYRYLNDPAPEVRGAVAEVLAQLGDRAAIPKLNPLLSDPNAKVADRANRAIQRLQRGAEGGAARP